MNRIITLAVIVAGLFGALPSHPATARDDTAAFMTGVTVYYDVGVEDDRAVIARLLDRRAERHDTAVSLVIPFAQARWDSSSVTTPDDLTPSLAQVRSFVRAAHERDLAVMLKPLLDEASLVETGPSGTWRGLIWPDDMDAWFARYGEMMRRYAELAKDEGVAWLVIGSELNSLEAPRFQGYWWDLIEHLRTVLAGSSVKLTYGQNWDMVPSAPSWFGALDALSIDAYFPLYHVTNGASVDQLVDAFARHAPAIAALRANFPDTPLFFTEVGIRSQSNAYANPWAWIGVAGQPPNLEAQRAYFAAACQFYGSVGDGLFWWMVSLSPPSEPTQDSGFAFIGKPAEREVDRCSAEHRQ